MYHSTQIQDEPLGGTCLALSGLNILQRNNRNRNRNLNSPARASTLRFSSSTPMIGGLDGSPAFAAANPALYMAASRARNNGSSNRRRGTVVEPRANHSVVSHLNLSMESSTPATTPGCFKLRRFPSWRLLTGVPPRRVPCFRLDPGSSTFDAEFWREGRGRGMSTGPCRSSNTSEDMRVILDPVEDGRVP